jgi:hypothetical protein
LMPMQRDRPEQSSITIEPLSACFEIVERHAAQTLTWPALSTIDYAGSAGRVLTPAHAVETRTALWRKMTSSTGLAGKHCVFVHEEWDFAEYGATGRHASGRADI